MPGSISVLIPCYNSGEFLEEAIESCRSQSRLPDEILVINDGSTDKATIAVLDAIRNSGVRVIDQANRGLAGARNAALRSTQSDYAYFLDADNKLLPHCLESLAELLDADPEVAAAYGRMRLWTGKGRGGASWGMPPNRYIILVRNLWDAGMMVRRSTIEAQGLLYDESMRSGYEDWELHIRLILSGLHVRFRAETTYLYRVHGPSLLTHARSRHNHIVSYIRTKHHASYEPQQLLQAKLRHAPGLLVVAAPEIRDVVQQDLSRQTFSDWVMDLPSGNGAFVPPKFFLRVHDERALAALPREAIESAMMYLILHNRAHKCILAIDSSVGAHPDQPRQGVAVALISRVRPDLDRETAVPVGKDDGFDLLFPRVGDGEVMGWKQVGKRADWSFRSLGGFRRELRRVLAVIISRKTEQALTRIYDGVYKSMHSGKGRTTLKRALSPLWPAARRAIERIIYTLILSSPPLDDADVEQWQEAVVHHTQLRGTLPLFFTDKPADRITLLVATTWLELGGVERELLDLISGLDRKKFRLLVATTVDARHAWEHRFRELDVELYHLGAIAGSQHTGRALAHLVLNKQVDCMYVVHSKAAYESLEQVRKLKPGLAVVDRSVLLEGPGEQYLQLSLDAGPDLIDIRTFGHRAIAQEAESRAGFVRAASSVIYHGIDMDSAGHRAARAGRRLQSLCGAGPETRIVIFAGRLAAQKRPHVFVDIAGRMLELAGGEDLQFAMLGTGELEDEIRQRISRKGLERKLHLLGPRDDTFELMADAALLLMPSAYEGLAIVSLEAMAIGLPQVFADVNGQGELIVPGTGVLVKNGSGEVERYAQACISLLRDDEMRAAMIQAGKARVRGSFSLDETVREYERLFERCVNQRKHATRDIPFLLPPHIEPLLEKPVV